MQICWPGRAGFAAFRGATHDFAGEASGAWALSRVLPTQMHSATKLYLASSNPGSSGVLCHRGGSRLAS